MTQSIQPSAGYAPTTNGWGFIPTNTTTDSVEGLFFIQASFQLPVRNERRRHGASKNIGDLVSKYELDPRKAAAMARARGNLASRLGSEPKFSLSKLRLAKGLSQSKLGELMGVAQPQVARYESGDDLKMSVIEKLAEALGVPEEEVYFAAKATRKARGLK